MSFSNFQQRGKIGAIDRSQNIAKLILCVSYAEKNMKLMSCVREDERKPREYTVSTVTLESACCSYIDFPEKLLFNFSFVRENIIVGTTAKATLQCFVQFNHDYSFQADIR